MNVYQFSSKTCEPCKVMKPVFDDLKEDFSQFTWHYIDIGNDPQKLREKYDVKFVPTLVVETPFGVEKHSGTTAMGYYRILKNAK
jgi:thiol-disulfide isomerase/thioredoxin